MILTSDVLTAARDVLADVDKTRWPDTTLIRILNEGIANFTITTKHAKSRLYLSLETNIGKYDISDYAINIERVMYLNRVLEAKSTTEMDKINLYWEDEIAAEPRYVIFDTLRPGVFKVYPKIMAGIGPVVSQNQVYGALIDIGFTDDVFSLPTFTSIEQGVNKYLVIDYIEKPELVSDLTDSIDIHEMYRPALIAYVSGQALRLDGDAQNRQFGAEQIQIYSSYVDKVIKNESSVNNTFHARTTAYRGGFE